LLRKPTAPGITGRRSVRGSHTPVIDIAHAASIDEKRITLHRFERLMSLNEAVLILKNESVIGEQLVR
jgi:hypothetical protein